MADLSSENALPTNSSGEKDNLLARTFFFRHISSEKTDPFYLLYNPLVVNPKNGQTTVEEDIYFTLENQTLHLIS